MDSKLKNSSHRSHSSQVTQPQLASPKLAPKATIIQPQTNPPTLNKSSINTAFNSLTQANKTLQASVKWIERKSMLNEPSASLVPALSKQNAPYANLVPTLSKQNLSGKRQSMHDFKAVGKSLVVPQDEILQICINSLSDTKKQTSLDNHVQRSQNFTAWKSDQKEL